MNKIFFVMLALMVSAAAAEVVVIDLHYEDGYITLNDKTVKLGYYPDRKIQPENGYRLEVVSFSGESLYSFRFKIPLEIFTDYTEGDELKGNVIRLNATDFSLIIPDYADAKEIRFYNERNYKVAEINVHEEKLAPKGSYLWIIAAAVAAVAALFIIKKRLRSK